jgi:RNA recognition motif-containing protein
MRDKLGKSTQVELTLFLQFNRIKSILGGGTEEEHVALLKQAVTKSQMLKLSKDGLKVKRRIPFDIKVVDKKQIDASTIYVENFPEHLTHRELAKLFARAGTIRNVTMPKYKDNFTSKGFAFVEFSDEKSAANAIELFNNCIPLEFTDAKCQNFVHV